MTLETNSSAFNKAIFFKFIHPQNLKSLRCGSGLYLRHQIKRPLFFL